MTKQEKRTTSDIANWPKKDIEKEDKEFIVHQEKPPTPPPPLELQKPHFSDIVLKFQNDAQVTREVLINIDDIVILLNSINGFESKDKIYYWFNEILKRD